MAPKQLLAFLSCVVGLSSFEAMLVNSQGRDFRFKRLPRESELGSGASRARDLAPAIRQRRFNDVLFMLGQCGGLRGPGQRPYRRCGQARSPEADA